MLEAIAKWIYITHFIVLQYVAVLWTAYTSCQTCILYLSLGEQIGINLFNLFPIGRLGKVQQTCVRYIGTSLYWTPLGPLKLSLHGGVLNSVVK